MSQNHFFKRASFLSILARLGLGFLLFVVMLWTHPIPVAHAGGVVTDCSTYGPGPGTLESALSGGGTVTFACSGTIIVPQITIKNYTTIDGSGQTVTLSGGGSNNVLYVYGDTTLNLNNLTIADGWSNTVNGGGILNYGTVNIHNCTLSNNNAPGGGAIDNRGVANISNSTLSGNTAGVGGGGIVTWEDCAANISNSTLSGNSAGDTGGGIRNRGTMTVTNTIVTNSPAGGDCDSSGTLNGANNLSDGSCPGTVAAVTNFDLTLADNGGDTWTHALLGGSNAIDNVSDCTYLSSGGNPLFSDGAPIIADQRGIVRPQGAACDIGAYEYIPPTGGYTEPVSLLALLWPWGALVVVVAVGVFVAMTLKRRAA